MKLLLPFGTVAVTFAQTSGDTALDANTRNQIIATALDRLDRSYVDPGAAFMMAAAIGVRQRRGEYNHFTNPIEFAGKLTSDLQAAGHDKHLRVKYSKEPVPENLDGPMTPEIIARIRAELAEQNYGFERVERLPGNVAYLDLRSFDPASLSGAKAEAAMQLLSDCEALIIDLRHNNGGDPAMVQLLASYLFVETPVHLDDIYSRPTDSTTQWWTLADLPGKRMPNAYVYVLTSQRTFSAAEEFAYDLQNLKRATIVGETTGGGAHPGREERIGGHFVLFVPRGRAINPVTKTDWEGTGVKPDIEVSAERALDTAKRMALQNLSARTKDPERRKRIDEAIAELNQMPSPK